MLCWLYDEDRYPSKASSFSFRQILKVGDPVSFTLSEFDVLLLDRAEYSFDRGEFQPAMEGIITSINGRRFIYYIL